MNKPRTRHRGSAEPVRSPAQQTGTTTGCVSPVAGSRQAGDSGASAKEKALSSVGKKKEPQKEGRQKLLEANVNLGKGKNDKLVIYEGFPVEKQVQEFAIKHSKSAHESTGGRHKRRRDQADDGEH